VRSRLNASEICRYSVFHLPCNVLIAASAPHTVVSAGNAAPLVKAVWLPIVKTVFSGFNCPAQLRPGIAGAALTPLICMSIRV
jgi:hypothetical protein